MPWQKRAIELLDKSLEPLPHELNELDWKEDLSANKDKLTQHLSAFANYPGGGFIVFGVEDATGKILGIEQQQGVLIVEKLANLARSALAPFVKLSHSVQTYQNKPLLFIYVHESATKPVHLRGKTMEDAFIRCGGTTRRATRQEVGGLLLNSKVPHWEELHASRLLSAGEVKQLLDYDTIHNLLGRSIPGSDDELMRWMEDEKMVKRMNGDGFYITNFGAISAARDLNKFDGVMRKAIRVIKYKGLNKVEAEREAPGHKGYAIGFKGLISFLAGILPQSEVIEKALRKKMTVYPEIALREFIANALIHQDFTIPGCGPMVEIFDDRIEITNPGRLLPEKKIDRLIRTNPQSRNEILAKAFRRYGICEERGTGIERAIIQIELFGLPPVKFEEGPDYFKTVLCAPRAYGKMSLDERILASYQHASIRYFASSGLTNTSLRERFHLGERSRPQISLLIRETASRKLIKAKDPSAAPKVMQYLPYWA